MSFPDVLPFSEFGNRRQKLQEILAGRLVDAALIAAHPDVYYFSGTAQNAYLLLQSRQPPVLYVRKYYPRATRESDIREIRSFGSMSDIIAHLRESGRLQHRPLSIGIEMDVLPLRVFQRFEKAFPGVEWQDISAEIRRIRSVKSDYELECCRRAAALLDKVFDQIPGWLKPGITEIELASEIERALRREGHQGFLPVHAFNSSIHYGNILFGNSGAVRGAFDGPTCGPGLYPSVPKGAGWKSLEPHEPVFIDLVSGVDGYMADATRVFSIGRLPDNLLDAHAHCIDIQNEVAARLRPGIAGHQLYDLAVQQAGDKGIAHVFMGPDSDRARFIAHGVGLEIDELPVLAAGATQAVPAGCILAIEPKAVFEGIGAVGIENTWHITSKGAVRLTEFPDDCLECGRK